MTDGVRLWRQVPSTLFQFTTTDRADLRIAVMQAFHHAAVDAPALTYAHVAAAVHALGFDGTVAEGDLDASLTALVGWGLLEASQDHTARYATAEEFERRNLRWTLTPHGQAAISGVIHSLEVLRRSVSLQPATLDAIGDGLADLAQLLAQPGIADSRVATRLAEVEHHLQVLVDNVRQFNRELNRLQRDDAVADDVFLDVKQRVTAYLQEFVDGVQRPARRIAQGIATLEADPGVAALHQRAVRGASLLAFDDEDPTLAWLDERARRWAALRSWFVAGDTQPQIDRVLDIARQAILSLLRVLERRWESRRRSASIRDDYLVLARWFAATPSDADAHRLFNAAFGVWPARHHHLLPDDPEDVPRTAGWLDAPPVPVAATLRTSGSTTNRGRVPPVLDPAISRARRQAAQARELAERAEIRDHLTTGGRVPLTVFGELPLDRFDALLELLSAALGAPRSSDGTRRTLSADGQVEIVLHEPAEAGSSAVLATSEGQLTAPGFEVEITLTGTSSGTARMHPNGVGSADAMVGAEVAG